MTLWPQMLYNAALRKRLLHAVGLPSTQEIWMMRRAGCVVFLFLAALTAGMSSDGCSVVVPGVTPRSAPPLTSEVSPVNSRLITLSADVSQYPDARTINWDFGD